MMKSKFDLFKDTKILRANEMMRYANRSKIKQESVASHSFFVSTNCYTIYQEYKQYGLTHNELSQAIMFAVVHDIGEVGTSDIPYDFKYSVPGLKEMLEVGEAEFIKKEFPQFHDTFTDFQKYERNNEVPYLVLKMADIGSVIQYSQNEINLGNSSKDMEEIHTDAIQRYIILEQKLLKTLEERPTYDSKDYKDYPTSFDEDMDDSNSY